MKKKELKDNNNYTLTGAFTYNSIESLNRDLKNTIDKFWPKSGPPTKEIEKYVKKYSKEKIVIKCGGRVLLDPILFNNFIDDIVILKKLGLTPLIVHGG